MFLSAPEVKPDSGRVRLSPGDQREIPSEMKGDVSVRRDL